MMVRKKTCQSKIFWIVGAVILILALFLARPLLKRLILKPDLKSMSTSADIPYQEVVFHGSREKKVVALTFDADMTPKMKKEYESGKVESWYNRKVIDVLKQNHVPATLFLTGMWIELYPKEAKELAKNPLFELANHSYSHPAFQSRCYALKLIPDKLDLEEITKTQKLLHEVTGKDNHLFRFPGGCYDKIDLEIVHKLGLRVIQWDSISNDSFNTNTQSLIDNIGKSAQNGSIILLHLNGGKNAPKTAEALPTIIANLKSRGFTFVKVSELIN
jgi:peptidoglycan/xylan/chitin deacetylase (PgdA/CDA1 family)